MKKRLMALLLAIALVATSNGFMELGSIVAHAAEGDATTGGTETDVPAVKEPPCKGKTDEKLHKNYTISYKWNEKTFTCVADVKCADCKETWEKECTITDKVTKEPTCEAEGEKTYTATVEFAGETDTSSITAKLPKAEHTYKEDKDAPAVKATCSSKGKEAGQICEVCGDKVEGADTDMLPHTEKVTKEAVAATCDKAGNTEQIECSVCGEVIKRSETTDALGHKYGAASFTWTNNYRTCSVSYKCTVCGLTLKETCEVAEPEVTKAATCTEDGVRTYTATCVCGQHTDTREEVIPALGHVENTVKEGTWKWNKDHTKCTVSVTCTRCDALVAKDAKVEIDETKKATCDKDGEIVYTASYTIGQKVYTTTYIEADEAGHIFAVNVPAKTPTCTEDGCSEGTACTRCGTVGTASRKLKAKGHNYVEIAGKAATCTEDGYTSSTECKACGDVKVKSEVIKAGHTYGKPDYAWTGYTACKAVFTCTACKDKVEQNCTISSKVVTAATCTAEGSTEHTATCTFNGETFTTKATETTAKTAHTEKVTVAAKEASCEAEGNTEEIKCSVCDTVIKASEKIPAKGHTETVSKAAKEATCTEAGYTEEKKCSVCNKVTVESKPVEAKGHQTTVVPAKEATCTEDGYTASVKCVVCNVVTEPAEVIKASHAYKLTEVEWSEEFKSCTATIVCDKCNEVAENQKCVQILHETGVEPTCTEEGGAFYTARFVYNGQELISERVLDVETVISPLGHKYDGDFCVRCKAEKPESEISFVKEQSTKDYTGKAVSVNSNVCEVTEGTGDITFEYYLDEGCTTPTFSGNDAKEATAPVKVGTYYVKALVSEDADHKAGETAEDDIHTFVIRPRRVGSLKAVNQASTIKLTWEKVPEADGYILYRRLYGTDVSAFKAIKTFDSNATLSYTDGNISQTKRYIYNIVAVADGEIESAMRANGTQIVRMKVVSVANQNGGVKVTWTKVPNAAGYKVYRKAAGSDSYGLVTTIKKGAATSYTDKTKKTLKNGKASTYYVVAYYKESSSVVLKTNTKTFYYVERPTVSSVEASKSKTLKVTWKKNSAATGYQVRYSTSSSMDGAKTVNGTSTSKTISGLKAGKTYYVQVRAYKTVNGTKYWSDWSAKKSKKTK